MQTAILLRRQDGKAAAAGWDGDAFAVFEGPDDRLGLVWASTWDTADDAREFARAYARFQTTKLGPDATEPDAFPDALRRPSERRRLRRRAAGQDVVVVEGFPSTRPNPPGRRLPREEGREDPRRPEGRGPEAGQLSVPRRKLYPTAPRGAVWG